MLRPPGSTASCAPTPRVRPGWSATFTTTLWPAARVPVAGVTVKPPTIRVTGTVMLYVTDPPRREAASSTVSVDGISVPGGATLGGPVPGAEGAVLGPVVVTGGGPPDGAPGGGTSPPTVPERRVPFVGEAVARMPAAGVRVPAAGVRGVADGRLPERAGAGTPGGAPSPRAGPAGPPPRRTPTPTTASTATATTPAT